MYASEPFAHPALFYRGVQEYVAGTVPFIEEGLAAGEPVAVAVPASNLRPLRRELGASAEQVRFTDMSRAGRNPGRIIPEVLRAFADAHPAKRVRIIGEPIWPARTPAEYPACVQHEALINRAFHGRNVTILCPYDAARLNPGWLADAYTTHPVVVVDGRAERSTAYDADGAASAFNELLVPPPWAVVFAFDVYHLSGARDLAVEWAERLGLTDERWNDFSLAVTELTTNSVRHGGGSGTVSVWGDGTQIVCEVRDRGWLRDSLAGRHPPQRDRPGGRGLLTVNNLADLVRVHTGPEGTTIRFYI
ncbi:putative regulator of sigma factor [Streptomyces himastatinicus ATCC 53653]|uniref:Putative regulator of sigma factor n=1 Tax=Streptomyces himastatinicus ATCC 53653 TaxID=457427 RepID=D9WGJ2_9ACTN|nr:sensor histidine kinase [Streptomyces himastatinicus]EFL25380.1 putative regulator of sigma factor [Streptomyces himastatinicus ATCC 53653]